MFITITKYWTLCIFVSQASRTVWHLGRECNKGLLYKWINLKQKYKYHWVIAILNISLLWKDSTIRMCDHLATSKLNLRMITIMFMHNQNLKPYNYYLNFCCFQNQRDQINFFRILLFTMHFASQSRLFQHGKGLEGWQKKD